MQDGTFKQGKGRNETGNSSTRTFISHSDTANTYLQQKKAIEELQPNKQLFTAQSLTQFYLQDTAPQYPYKTPKRK